MGLTGFYLGERADYGAGRSKYIYQLVVSKQQINVLHNQKKFL